MVLFYVPIGNLYVCGASQLILTFLRQCLTALVAIVIVYCLMHPVRMLNETALSNSGLIRLSTAAHVWCLKLTDGERKGFGLGFTHVPGIAIRSRISELHFFFLQVSNISLVWTLRIPAKLAAA